MFDFFLKLVCPYCKVLNNRKGTTDFDTLLSQPPTIVIDRTRSC